MEYLGEGFFYFNAIILNCRIWSSGVFVRSREGFLFFVCYDWYFFYFDFFYRYCGADDDIY